MTDPITTLLQKYDSAEGKSLSAFDRTRILHRARTATRRTRVRFAAAFAVLTLVIFMVVLRDRTPQTPPPAPPRQIQYATPGGTRIVWTLDPDFRM